MGDTLNEFLGRPVKDLFKHFLFLNLTNRLKAAESVIDSTFSHIATGGDAGQITITYQPIYFKYAGSNTQSGSVKNVASYYFSDGTCATLSLPDVTSFQYFNFAGYVNLHTLSMPNLTGNVTDGTIEFSSGAVPKLVNLTLGNIGVTKKLGQISLQGAALSQASVDAILALLVSLDGTNGTTLWDNSLVLDGGTSAPPSAQGLVHKATLEARGATINVNTGYTFNLSFGITAEIACSGVNSPIQYFTQDAILGVGTILYIDSLVSTPASDSSGFFSYAGSSKVYEVVSGEIVSQATCA